MDFEEVGVIVERHRYEESALIPILQDIQKEANWLPQDLLKHLSKKLGVPLSRIYGIASFYKAFSLKPRGKYLINVCRGTACHVRGSVRILEKIERDLGIKAGETTEDLNFSLEAIRCVGCCSLAPVMRIGEDTHGRLTQGKIPKILKKYELKEENSDEGKDTK